MDNNFSVRENDCIGFDSQWKVKKITMHASSQTNVVTEKETSTITHEMKSCSLQTDEQPEQKVPPYNEQHLAEFLNRLYPKLSKELNDAASSQVFKNYHSAQSSYSTESAKLLSSFKTARESGDYRLSVSSLSWNSTGNKIAMSTVQHHDSWCHHQGFVHIYKLHGSQIVTDNFVKIKAPNCVTCVEFHPLMPPVLAAGTHTGEILIWNTQNKDSEMILEKIMAHHENVTQVSWIYDLDSSKNVLLATGSLDGFLNLWQFDINSSELKLCESYKIKPSMFGRLQRKSALAPEIAKKADRGIIAFDFSNFTPEIFVVAAEGGLVVQCSRLGAQELNESKDGVSVKNPVFQYYRSHEGEITSIFLSPERQELFMTNGSEGEIHLFTFGEEEPGKIIFVSSPTLYTTWVPYSQNMIAACGTKGTIQFYNSKNGKLLKDIEGNEGIPLVCIKFHKARISNAAVGTKDGSLQFWNIPWNNF